MADFLMRYSMDFAPLFLEGYTAHLIGAGLPDGGLDGRCTAVGALPEYQKDFGALTAAVWTRDQEDTNLEMNTMELAQFRMRITDDIRITIKNPAAIQQWRTKDTQFYLSQFPSQGPDALMKFLFAASEFFVWEDNTPRFDLYSELTTLTSNILFSGWRFRFEAMKPGTPGYIAPKMTIYISEWPTTLRM